MWWGKWCWMERRWRKERGKMLPKAVNVQFTIVSKQRLQLLWGKAKRPTAGEAKRLESRSNNKTSSAPRLHSGNWAAMANSEKQSFVIVVLQVSFLSGTRWSRKLRFPFAWSYIWQYMGLTAHVYALPCACMPRLLRQGAKQQIKQVKWSTLYEIWQFECTESAEPSADASPFLDQLI